jgi:hypothetical protein
MELAGCNALGVSANPLVSAISNLKSAALQIKQQSKVTFCHVFCIVTHLHVITKAYDVCGCTLSVHFAIFCLQTFFFPVHRTTPGLHLKVLYGVGTLTGCSCNSNMSGL